MAEIRNPYEGDDSLKDPWGDGATRNPYADSEPEPEAEPEAAPKKAAPKRRFVKKAEE